MWAFKTLYDKGLVYEGKRVLPYCWNDETPLSNHELRMDDDVYQMRQDPASTVWMRARDRRARPGWTTTPWTLRAQPGIVVGPDIDYAVMEHPDGHRYILGEARLAAYEKELAGRRPAWTRSRAASWSGARTPRIFDFLVDQLANVPAPSPCWPVTSSRPRTAPGWSRPRPPTVRRTSTSARRRVVPVILTVDEGARFTSIAPRFEGLQVFDANKPLLKELRERGMLLRQDSYDHSYPHCWRCRKPLIYMAVSSWFVEVTKIRDRMVELNEQITWVPEHIKHGQFGKWLANARDWSICRNRFWGSPIPVWQSDDPAYPRTRRLRLVRGARARLRGRRSPTCTGRSSTS